jgi:membrane fusion protein, heavy metal efflux system
MNSPKFQSRLITSVREQVFENKKLFLSAITMLLILLLVLGLESCKKEEIKEPTPSGTVDFGKKYVDLNDKQAANLKMMPVEMVNFTDQFSAYGSIDFNENAAVQIYTPYQGKIIQSFVDVGDFVSKGQALFTVDSSDLAQAQSSLLSAKGVFDQSSATLARAKELYALRSISLKELEQNISDQNAAEATLKAAREAVRIFGKTSQEIFRIENERRLDTVLVVTSPLNGQVVARNAQPGLFVQPGAVPPPFVVADVANKWLIINASEEDSTKLRVGQDLEVTIPVLPAEKFKGKIKIVGSIVDPSTRTVLVRADISDPKRILRSGMYATYMVKGDKSIKSVGVPEEAVVREADGSMSVWTTTDGHHWIKRSIKLGLKTNGFLQVTEGLKEGEKIASTGAIFLSNMLDIDK